MGEIGKRKIKLENILAVAKDSIENIECNSGRKYSRAMKNAVNNYRKVVRLARKIEKSHPDYRILLNKSIVDKLNDFNRYKREHRNDWLSPAIYATSIAIIGVGALIAADYSLRKANAQDIPAPIGMNEEAQEEFADAFTGYEGGEREVSVFGVTVEGESDAQPDYGEEENAEEKHIDEIKPEKTLESSVAEGDEEERYETEPLVEEQPKVEYTGRAVSALDSAIGEDYTIKGDYLYHNIRWRDTLERIARRYTGVRDCVKIKLISNAIARYNGLGKETDTMGIFRGKMVQKEIDGEIINVYVGGEREDEPDLMKGDKGLIGGRQIKIHRRHLSPEYSQQF